MNNQDKNNPQENLSLSGQIKLSEQDLAAAVKILSAFRIAISNIRLYPPSSKIVEDSITDVYGRIQNLVSKYGQLFIAEATGSIVINGSILRKNIRQIIPKDVYEAFIQTLIQAHIKCISFYQNLTYDDFSFFMTVFSEKHWRREGDMMVLTAILKEKGISSIKLNERVYKAVGEDDLVVEKGMDYLERNEGALDSLMRSLEEVVDMAVFDEKGNIKDDVKRFLINKIINLKPEMLIKFFERKRTPEIEDVKQKVVEGMPPHHVKELVFRVVEVYKEIKQNSPPGSKKEKELAKLKETINRLLSSCSDRDTTVAIFNELKNENLEELLPEWWNKPEKSQMGLMVSKARLLTEKDSLELLQPDVRNELGRIIKEMDAVGKQDIIKGILLKFAENFRAKTADTRFEAVKLYNKIISDIKALSAGELSDLLETVIRESVETETDSRVYDAYGKILIDSTRAAVKEYDYEKAEQILRMFRKHKRLENEGFAGKSVLAAAQLQKAAASPEMLRLLINDIQSRDRSRQGDAYKVLIQMEETVTPGIIEAIKKNRDIGLREIMAAVIKKYGRNAVLSLINELEKDIPAVHMIRIIEILPSLECDSVSLSKLEHTINHHASEVRAETVSAAVRLKGEKENLLLYALDDENPEVRKRAIEALGNMRSAGLFYSFKNKEKNEQDEKYFCEAIGKINLDEAAEYLSEIAKDVYFWQRKHSREVRISAIRALEHYKNDKTVRLLRKLSGAKDRFIRSNAELVLEKWENS